MPIVVAPRYRRNGAEKYNRPDEKRRRLVNREMHQKMKEKQTYCSLPSYACTINKNGRKYRKKGLSRQKQSYVLCRRAICSQFWDMWYTLETLRKATIPEHELKKLGLWCKTPKGRQSTRVFEVLLSLEGSTATDPLVVSTRAGRKPELTS